MENVRYTVWREIFRHHWKSLKCICYKLFYSILHFSLFAFRCNRFYRHRVHLSTGSISYSEYHKASERVTTPRIGLPGLLFHWWTAILLHHNNTYGNWSTYISHNIYLQWHHFDLSYISWLRLVDYQRVSIVQSVYVSYLFFCYLRNRVIDTDKTKKFT